MNKLSSFSSEMEKISKAKLPAEAITGGLGALIGFKRGFQGSVEEQRQDDQRLSQGFISDAEWKKRRDMRVAQGIATTAAWGGAGASIPHAGRTLRKWLSDAATDAAQPLGKELERTFKKSSDYMEARYTKALQEQADYIVDRAGSKMRGAGRDLGEGFAEGLHGVTVGQGKPPVVIIKHKAPWQP